MLSEVRGLSQATLAQPSYHVSLSRVVPIRYHEIEPLLLSIKEALVPVQRCAHDTIHIILSSLTSKAENLDARILSQLCFWHQSVTNFLGRLATAVHTCTIWTCCLLCLIICPHRLSPEQAQMPCRTDLSFGGVEVFENDDRTRTFLALGVAKGRHEV